MSMIEEIGATELKSRLDSGENIRLIDVRSDMEYRQGIIEGGEFMPLHTVPLRMDELSNDVTNVIYCRSGRRSAQACLFLKQQADINAINLYGGIISWSHAGFAVVKPKPQQ
ncbi:MAG: sulfurtransferase [Proteobacteria bacterium]|nr:MAG: sulfurtransferase [Pseudomonadota bacterium]